jgi:hypothetical protein
MGGGDYFQLPMNGEKSFLLVQVKINQRCRSFLVTKKINNVDCFQLHMGDANHFGIAMDGGNCF